MDIKTKAIAIMAVWSMATLGPAPIRDGAYRKPIAEQSQAQLAAQQRLQRTQTEVGSVPTKGETPPVATDTPSSEAQAQDNVGNVVINDPQAEKNLEGEDKRIRTTTNRGKPMWFGLLALMVGLSAVFGLKSWADKKIPFNS